MKRQISVLLVLLVFLSGTFYTAHKENKRIEHCAAIAPVSPTLSFADAALTAYDGLKTCLTNSPSHWYANMIPSFVYATAWPLGQQIQATLDMLKVQGANKEQLHKDLSRLIDGLHYYWDDDENPPGYNSTVRNMFETGSMYYDDNSWIGLALLDAFELIPENTWLLNQAELIFELQLFASEQTVSLPAAGGVLWAEVDGNKYTATVSTAGAVQLALRLHQITQAPHYLKFAVDNFEWIQRSLQAKNGLYEDGIRRDGSIDYTLWSYNQGLMIGDATLLFKSTGDRKYLLEAQRIAAASLAYYAVGSTLWNQPPIFNAIFFKNLQRLDDVAPDPRYRTFMEGYAHQLLANLNQNGVFRYNGRRTSLDQSGAIQIFALLAS